MAFFNEEFLADKLQQRVGEILTDHDLQEEAAECSQAESIESLNDRFGWEAVCRCLMDRFRDDSQEDHWRVLMAVFWEAVLDGRELPADELIAWLYHRFDPHGQAEDNLVWSITSKLKGVGYLSKYNPLSDPGVLQHLQRIECLE